MARATFVQDGNSVDYTPGSAVAAGDVIVQGTLVGIARTPIAASILGSLAVRGIFDVVKAAVEIAAGAAVYWDADGDPVGGTAGTGAATTTRTGNTFMGFAVAAAADTAATVRADLRSVEAAAAETLGLGDLSDVGPVSYTAGKVLVADGNSLETVAVSGNATLAATGALTVTGAAVGDTKEITFGTSKLVRSGNNVIATLPTVDPAVAGALWVDGVAVKVSAGE
ncbi:MAG: DUF2190 family protein [Planctomycetaceae bacterium]|nr:DUF2190 family protein [Planctomycetaceae bacterium]